MTDGSGSEPQGGEQSPGAEPPGDGSVRAVFDDMFGRIERSDVLIVATAMVAVYTLFTIFVLLRLGITTGTPNAIASAWRELTFLFAAYAMLALALNLHWGYTGLFNIGVAGFMAVGVYTMALLSTPADAISGQGLGLPLPIGVIGGMIAAALVGLVAAVPALRVRADYFAIVTLGLSEIIRLTLNSRTLSEWTLERFGFATGGGSGIDLPDRPTDALFDTAVGEALIELFVVEIGGEEVTLVAASVLRRFTWAVVMLAITVGFYWLLRRIGFSPFGRVLKSIREDELVAQSLGKDTRIFKIKVFMLGCALMGLAGILWQGSQGFVSPDSFRPIVTFYVFVAVIIGGSGSNTGSVIGALFFVSLLFLAPRRVGGIVDARLDLLDAPGTFAGAVDPLITVFNAEPMLAYAIDNISALQFILLGVVLILIVQYRPDGVMGHRTETAAAADLDRPNRGESDE
ncbi:branched-chain amino acid ABC transporter permease [Halorubrum vacuolatum]|uniref:Amino acid/amide ABC transporter membrane protein 2, HAAT family n=1 Tax=Halorubrum vacuolatum TaxID=63740 RepID=A0A238V8A3_HALVU|nr:branched-chain amino acid ABC transporter permease [Halorubrum vacuolatum]SNR30431.1 amino acid/amide ABC transporter membrane protein 2, HAAT family [Halorubrum vacuolatum]